MIRVDGRPDAPPPVLVCPQCGESTYFDVRWVGDLSQAMTCDGRRRVHPVSGL
jgi:hypothetical protein